MEVPLCLWMYLITNVYNVLTFNLLKTTFLMYSEMKYNNRHEQIRYSFETVSCTVLVSLIICTRILQDNSLHFAVTFVIRHMNLVGILTTNKIPYTYTSTSLINENTHWKVIDLYHDPNLAGLPPSCDWVTRY